MIVALFQSYTYFDVCMCVCNLYSIGEALFTALGHASPNIQYLMVVLDLTYVLVFSSLQIVRQHW